MQSPENVKVAIIGDIAFNHDISPFGEKISRSGSAYSSAVSASKYSKEIGVVARIGPDFDLSTLTKRGVDTQGVVTIPDGKTPRFVVFQHPDGTRDFSEERGVASEVDPVIFPESYLKAKFIHLATSLPQHHLIWIEALKSKTPESTWSADTFEAFVKKYPEQTKKALEMVGMVFTNEEELNELRHFGEVSFQVPLILKRGPAGAVYIDGENIITIPAPKVRAVDTSGAGDILAGVFLALRTKGFGVEESLKEAVNVASLSVTEFGIDHVNPINDTT